jgi:hypothetical protein
VPKCRESQLQGWPAAWLQSDRHARLQRGGCAHHGVVIGPIQVIIGGEKRTHARLPSRGAFAAWGELTSMAGCQGVHERSIKNGRSHSNYQRIGHLGSL